MSERAGPALLPMARVEKTSRRMARRAAAGEP